VIGRLLTSHFALLLVFAFFVSLVFATLMRDEPRSQLRTGALMFGGFVAVAVVIGWLMLPLPL
jgi:heme/copper-type cytochrome/quinol oxidase subunit 4